MDLNAGGPPKRSSPVRPRGREGKPPLAGKLTLLARILGRVFSWLLLVQYATWRRNEEDVDKLDRRLAKGEKTIVAFWHGRYTPLFVMLRDRHACIFVSDSFRGEVIAGICRCFGHDPVKISDNGGRESLQLMRSALADSLLVGIAVDGPLGPRHRVKQAIISLASEMGFSLLPASFRSRRSRIVESRWDRMEIPGLFTGVKLLFGEPMDIPPNLDRWEVRSWSIRLGEALEELETVETVPGSSSSDDKTPNSTRIRCL